jgi:hypothetical protein
MVSTVEFDGYHLANGATACAIGNTIVLLDVGQDEYFGLSVEHAQTLRRLSALLQIPVPVVDESGTDEAAAESEFHAAIQELIGRRLLDKDARRSYRIKPTPGSITRPTEALVDGYAHSQPRLKSLDFLNLCAASAKVGILQRIGGFARALQHAHHRNARLLSRELDPSRAREKMLLYQRSRALLFTANQACLFDSLVAHEYLAHYGIGVHIVLGVAVAPFKAHCWLQRGSVVVNDSAAYVSEFTPILVV